MHFGSNRASCWFVLKLLQEEGKIELTKLTSVVVHSTTEQYPQASPVTGILADTL